jgi:hypothetical protein
MGSTLMRERPICLRSNSHWLEHITFHAHGQTPPLFTLNAKTRENTQVTTLLIN